MGHNRYFSFVFLAFILFHLLILLYFSFLVVTATLAAEQADQYETRSILKYSFSEECDRKGR